MRHSRDLDGLRTKNQKSDGAGMLDETEFTPD